MISFLEQELTKGKLTHHAEAFIDKNVVSTVSGYLSKKEKDSLIFTVNAEFHVSKNSYDSMIKSLVRKKDKLIHILKEKKNPTTKGKPFEIVETYLFKK